MPIQRSLAVAYTHDYKVYDGQYHNQYLFGPYFLVAPVESDKEFVKVYLPEGEWYYLYNGQRYAGNTEIVVECPLRRLPVFVRGGAIIPMQAPVSHTHTRPDLLVLHLYAGADTSFTYYDDDGSTYDYQQDASARRTIQYSAHHRRVTLGAVQGSFRSPVARLKVVFHGFDGGLHAVDLNGHRHEVAAESNSYFSALEKFDPFYDPEPAPSEDVLTLTTDYPEGELVVTW
jgi:alpha-glucosidase